MNAVETIKKAEAQLSNAKKLSVFSQNALHILADCRRDLQTIAGLAEKEEAIANKELTKIGDVDGINELSAAALKAMQKLYEFVETMEVSNVTD